MTSKTNTQDYAHAKALIAKYERIQKRTEKIKLEKYAKTLSGKCFKKRYDTFVKILFVKNDKVVCEALNDCVVPSISRTFHSPGEFRYTSQIFKFQKITQIEYNKKRVEILDILELQDKKENTKYV